MIFLFLDCLIRRLMYEESFPPREYLCKERFSVTKHLAGFLDKRSSRESRMSKARAKSTLTAIATTSRSEMVEHQLRDFILSNKLVPGHKLPSESELSNDLGVSRTAIREGLKSLEAVGVVNAHQGKGRFVGKFDSGAMANNLAISLTIDPPSLREILEIRKTLETG